MIQHRFQQHIALIERTLEVTQWQAMDFNAELTGQIRARLRARGGEQVVVREALRGEPSAGRAVGGRDGVSSADMGAVMASPRHKESWSWNERGTCTSCPWLPVAPG